MVSQNFRRQLEGYGLTTANILYRRPDHPWLLQSYVWQDYDLCPAFPVLNKFLNFWLETLEGPLHSVTVAHARLIKPAEIRRLTACSGCTEDRDQIVKCAVDTKSLGHKGVERKTASLSFFVSEVSKQL